MVRACRRAGWAPHPGRRLAQLRSDDARIGSISFEAWWATAMDTQRSGARPARFNCLPQTDDQCCMPQKAIRVLLTHRRIVPLIMLALGVAAIGLTIQLQQRGSASHDARARLAAVELELHDLQRAPFRASPNTGGSPALARGLMRGGQHAIASTLARLRDDDEPAALDGVDAPLRANYAALQQIYEIGASTGEYDTGADRLAAVATRSAAAADVVLGAASRTYDRRASEAEHRSTVGAVAAIVVLLVAFGLLFRLSSSARERAEDLVGENERLLATSRREAVTDALTGLPNRRALNRDLELALEQAARGEEAVLALFDLDGFKQYNDTFGHPAGDRLLARLAGRLAAATEDRAECYRMGGDEFCVLTSSDRGDDVIARAAAALRERGEGFEVGASFGVAHLPTEAADTAGALRLADQRLYEHKATRSSASRQIVDVLLCALGERDPDLLVHLDGTVALATAMAHAMDLPNYEIQQVRLGAALHDIGKIAIPSTILDKPGPLDAEDWAFMRRHTQIGERIVRSAPSVAHVAELVRASHERYDGTGYPDALGGDDIPLGARIIAVCDAFEAMTSDRPYCKHRSAAAALDELRRCAGTQFDPTVVTAFCALERSRTAPLPLAS
jgi:diguanylate cyclase (GGDEF)-like protein